MVKDDYIKSLESEIKELTKKWLACSCWPDTADEMLDIEISINNLNSLLDKKTIENKTKKGLGFISMLQ